jgi:hypothetical protein
MTYAFQQKRDRCSPTHSNYLVCIAKFTTDIRHTFGQHNVVIGALPRFESATAPPSYVALAASQDSDEELQTLLQLNTTRIFCIMTINICI